MDPPPPEARIGETREERLEEFLEENEVTVVALREQSWLVVERAGDVAAWHRRRRGLPEGCGS